MKKFIVTKEAQRPAAMNGCCFYCQQPIGTEHKSDCVLVLRRVKVKVTIEYDISVPSLWDKKMIEFHRNEGTWCSSNMIEELETYSKEIGCLCPVTKFKYIREVSEPTLNER